MFQFFALTIFFGLLLSCLFVFAAVAKDTTQPTGGIEAVINKCVNDVLSSSAKTDDIIGTITKLLIDSVNG